MRTLPNLNFGKHPQAIDYYILSKNSGMILRKPRNNNTQNFWHSINTLPIEAALKQLLHLQIKPFYRKCAQ